MDTKSRGDVTPKSCNYDNTTLAKSCNYDDSTHVETVVLLSDKKVDEHININLDVEKLGSKPGTSI